MAVLSPFLHRELARARSDGAAVQGQLEAVRKESAKIEKKYSRLKSEVGMRGTAHAGRGRGEGGGGG